VRRLALLGLVLAPALARAEGTVIEPFATVVGGLEVETVQSERPDDNREGRSVTLALSRFGLRADLGGGVSIESEFEANAGPHGTSAWEGQAALSVRNQLVRLERGPFWVEAGRITDPSSVDFFSVHVMDQLLTDGYTRGSLLASGFNRGNGVQARWNATPTLSLGLNLNAANPVSTTSSLVVGGTFPPFSRFYFAPYQYVGRDSANFPADEYHFLMLSPSLMLRGSPVEVNAAIQMFTVNTNTSQETDQHIDGYNLRAGASTRVGRVRPFANVSFVQNEVVDPDDGSRLSGDLYTGLSLSIGTDVDLVGRSGVGAQVAYVRDRQGQTAQATQWFLNLGATWWLGAATAVAARVAVYTRCEDPEGDGCARDGERSLFLTIRTSI
jgi:hypothetical protein